MLIYIILIIFVKLSKWGYSLMFWLANQNPKMSIFIWKFFNHPPYGFFLFISYYWRSRRENIDFILMLKNILQSWNLKLVIHLRILSCDTNEFGNLDHWTFCPSHYGILILTAKVQHRCSIYLLKKFVFIIVDVQFKLKCHFHLSIDN